MADDRILKSNWINTYLEFTKTQESPELFHLWTAIAVIAGVLRRNVFVGRGYYKLYPNMYVVLVAPTGRCRKSTAASIGVKMMKEVDGLNIIHEKITPEGLISQLFNSSPRVSVLEDHLKMTCMNHAFVFAPELSVFLGSASYTPGLIELLTSLYEGKDFWDYTTKMHGKMTLYNVCLNLFGASNPEWLAKGLSEDSFGGGFMGRTLFVFQSANRKRVAWPTTSDQQNALRLALLADLQKMSRLKGEFQVTKEAYEYYETWYNAYEGDYTGRLAGYFERKPEHILKLAMVLSVAEDDSLIINMAHIKCALDMLNALEPTMQEAFAYIGATNEARNGQHVIRALRENGGWMGQKQLLRTTHHLIRSIRDFYDIVGLLSEAGVINSWEHNRKNIYVLTTAGDKFAAFLHNNGLTINPKGEIVEADLAAPMPVVAESRPEGENENDNEAETEAEEEEADAVQVEKKVVN